MSRTVLLTFTLAALAAGALPAQVRTPKDFSAADLLGIWEGPYQSDAVPPGTLRLTVTRNASREWQVTLEVLSDQAPTAGAVRDFRVEEDRVSWVQDVADLTCASSATVAAGVMKGTAECSQNGAVVVTANFLLERKKD
jgi:hypothetical protein